LETRKERPGERDVDRRIQVEGWRKMEAEAQNGVEYVDEWGLLAYAPPTGNDKD